jgi:hypothetical protein
MSGMPPGRAHVQVRAGDDGRQLTTAATDRDQVLGAARSVAVVDDTVASRKSLAGNYVCARPSAPDLGHVGCAAWTRAPD